jgi:hypothetical protein
VNWAECTVSVGLARQAVKNAPRYEATALLDREQEARIHTHYGRNGYWSHEAKHESGILR